MALKQDIGFFDVGANCPDLVIENGDLKADQGLETAALISLYTDKRVAFEELPLGLIDRRGWWADLISDIAEDEIGSRLWTLDRGKLGNSTPVEMEAMLVECFDWLIDDGIASGVEVSAELIGQEGVQGSVNIFRPNGEDIPYKFMWDGQKLKLVERNNGL